MKFRILQTDAERSFFMFSTETFVTPDSDYYIFDPSHTARAMYLYPLDTGRFTYKGGYKLTRTSYDSYLLMHLEEGSLFLNTRNHDFEAAAGDTVLLDCHEPHSYGTDAGCVTTWLHFDGVMGAKYFELISGHDRPVIRLENPEPVLTELTKIYHIFRDGKPIVEAAFNLSITAALTELIINGTPSERILPSDAVGSALSFIREHITDEFSISDVAEYVHLSPYYFNRLFKKRTGFTPHDYILNLRLNNACYLLRTSNHTVKEICFLTGFQSESAFCQSFKHVKGVTPSAYREGSIPKN